jgi:hypothetical protein
MCHITHQQTEGIVTMVICTSRGLTYWMISRVGDPHIPLESGSHPDSRIARDDAFSAFRAYCHQYNGDAS